ncbi:ataxin-7-like protein 1 [Phyllopteryx taeniolatus]|uniref:ataxin-7-like protein 1 n=1 Tax=Phyllopteryx taeniolatus TaxID=161469 RepID=UPI002AD34ACB|nr:ataxin-7-like protein 1 [Phyllopteryx taeniolatus]XP_061617467.1 ataxin-7-like protein 1 [Phyllopteryx taeniolatus]XP_061617468.1 ataxin-7-like protein 1 [Phyllopteryx taeniolatus]XP_061617469.1 ataxin-7-like protein 1 [Phyllopteryx taeniolatus]XP_061617470.1 ataxin-7-like protein 1 [Phyllopteryx taeniolatus]XP_061617472.1 ataxin-7-like protein 1 [Phyllopteryx taeniolatus]
MHSKNQKRHSSPVPSRSPLVLMKAKAPAVASGPEDALAFRIPKDYPHSRFSKAPLAVYPPKGARSKPCVSLPVVSLEKMPCLSRANSTSQVRLAASSSSPSLSPLKHPPLPAVGFSNVKLPNGRGNTGPSTPRSSASPSSLDVRPSPARSPPDRRPASSLSPSPAPLPAHRPASQLSSLSPSEKKNQNGTKASSRSHNRLSGRIFDPNKHCGVQDPETKQPCTRSLTCKTHSLTHRRAVPGRRKHFDVLLAEHRGRTKEKDAAKEKDKDGCSPSVVSQDAASPSKSQCPNGRALSTLKLKLANAHIPRVPGITTSAPQLPPPAPFAVPGPFPVPASNPEHSPQPWTTTAGGDGERLSSDDGDAQTPEDAHPPIFHFSKVHPQPSGFCIFSSRLMGRGHYVFDRRWDRMRLALQNMVEKHLNAQMWRKVPLAAESLSSLSPSGGTSQQAPLPSPPSDTRPPLTTPSSSISCGPSFPHPISSPRSLTFRDAPQPISTLGASHHSAHRASRPTKEREDSFVGAKRKNSSYYCSFRNGTSYHPPLQASGGPDATLARKKGHGREGNGLWSYSDHWLSKADGSRSHNSNNSDLGNTGISYSASRELTAAPSSGALNYGQKAEGRKRKSGGSYEGKTGNKLNRLGGVDGFFGNGNDSESQRQAELHH